MMISSMMNLKIMIVDDVSAMRKVLKSILVDHCKVDPIFIFEADDGADAIETYDLCNPDIVFLDIAMPDSDGKAIVKKLIEIDPEAKIIMCTGSSDKQDVIECIRAGAKDYVRKPITPDRISTALEKVIRGG